MTIIALPKLSNCAAKTKKTTTKSKAAKSTAKKLPPATPEAAEQFDFFGTLTVVPSPVVEALRTLDLNGFTPLQALNKLFELQQQAGE